MYQWSGSGALQPWSHGVQGVDLRLNTGGTIGESPVIATGAVNATGQLNLDLPVTPPVQDTKTFLNVSDMGTDSSYVTTCTNNLTISNSAMKGASAFIEGQSQTNMATVVGLKDVASFNEATLHLNQYSLVFVDSSGSINGTADCTVALKTAPTLPLESIHMKYNNVLLLKGWNVILNTLSSNSVADDISIQVDRTATPTVWHSGSN